MFFRNLYDRLLILTSYFTPIPLQVGQRDGFFGLKLFQDFFQYPLLFRGQNRVSIHHTKLNTLQISFNVLHFFYQFSAETYNFQSSSKISNATFGVIVLCSFSVLRWFSSAWIANERYINAARAILISLSVFTSNSRRCREKAEVLANTNVASPFSEAYL